MEPRFNESAGDPGNDPVCRQCGYALHGLPSPRCPECGRDFDLADSATFDTLRAHLERAASPRAVFISFSLAMLLFAGAFLAGGPRLVALAVILFILGFHPGRRGSPRVIKWLGWSIGLVLVAGIGLSNLLRYDLVQPDSPGSFAILLAGAYLAPVAWGFVVGLIHRSVKSEIVQQGVNARASDGV